MRLITAKQTISNKIKLYFALSLFTFASILATGEIMARYFVKENRLPLPPPYSKIEPYSPNPYIIGMRPFMHFHIPGSHYTQSRSYYAVDYSINSSGFRGPEIQPKSKDKKRAVIIGDSIVEGHGCEFQDTFSYKLGEKAKSFNWEVLNLGVQGACPSYFAANMDRYMATEPDAAIIVMFENDLYDDRIQERSYFGKPILDNPSQLYQRGNSWLNHLFTRAKLFTLTQRAFRQIKQNSLEEILRQNGAVNTHNEEQNNLDKISPWLVAPSMFDTQWEMSSKYLGLTVEKFRQSNIPIIFVNIALGTLLPELDSAHRNHAYMLNDKIEKWAKANSIAFFSLVPEIEHLMKSEHVDSIMIRDDGHPTEKTHQIFADTIWQWIGTLGQ